MIYQYFRCFRFLMPLAFFGLSMAPPCSVRAEPPRDEIRNVRALIVIDHHSDPPLPGIEKNEQNIVHLLRLANRYTGRVDIDYLAPEDISPETILDYYRDRVEVSKDDALVFYYAGHGGTHPRTGPFLQTSNGSLARSALIDAMRARDPRLVVVLTDSCSVVPSLLPPLLPAPQAPNFVLQDLLFRHEGVVDINASSYDRSRGVGEYAWYIEEKGGLFTDALFKAIFRDYDELDTDANQFVGWDELLEMARTLTRENYRHLRDLYTQFDEELLFAAQRTTQDLLIAQRSQTPQAFNLGRPIPPLPPARAPGIRPGSSPELLALGLDLNENYGYGLRVAQITGWAAEQATGLRPGDLVAQFNGQPVDDLETAERLLVQTPLASPLVVDAWTSESNYGTRNRFVLGASNAEHVSAALSAALSDPADSVREASAHAIVRLGQADPATIEALGQLLKEDPDVRNAAATALAELGEPGIAILAPFASAMDSDLRSTAHRSLLQIGAADRHAVRALIDALSSDSAEVRLDAIVSLGQIRIWTAEVYNALEPIARGGGEQPDGGSEQIQALITLYHLGSRLDEPLRTRLLGGLRSGDESIREAVGIGLRAVRPASADVVEALVSRLDDESNDVRYIVANSLGIVGATQRLTEALNDEEPSVRILAASSLGRMGINAAGAADDLAQATQDDDLGVRREAANALRSLGPAAIGAVPALIELLSDEDAQLRSIAILALGEIGPRAEAAVPGLIAALDDPDPNLREEAAHALGSIGPLAIAAVPRLKELLIEDDMVAAGAAIANIRGVQSLIQIAEEGTEATRATACTALGNPFNFFPREVVPFLAAALESPREATRQAAAEALRMMLNNRINGAAPGMEEALHKISRFLRDQPTSGLIHRLSAFDFDRDAIASLLVELLEANDPSVRAAAASSLGNLGPAASGAVPMLVVALQDERSAVRSASAGSLGLLGEAEPPVIAALVAALNDPESWVSRSAIASLIRLGAIPEVVSALEQGPLQTRVEVARILTTPRARPAIPALIRALNEDESSEVRAAVAATLAGTDPFFSYFEDPRFFAPAAPPPRVMPDILP